MSPSRNDRTNIEMSSSIDFLYVWVQVLGFILNDPSSEITVTIITGYGAYLLAECTGIHASGVLSMVCAGLYLSFYGLGRISARVTSSLHSFWQMADYITNTIIFFISGLIMAEKALISKFVKAEVGGCED